MPENIDDIFTGLQPSAPPPPPKFLEAVAGRRRKRRVFRCAAAAAVMVVVGVVGIVASGLRLPSSPAPAMHPTQVAGIESTGKDHPAGGHLPTALALSHLNRDLDVNDLILPDITGAASTSLDPLAPDGGGRGVILDAQRIEEIVSH